MRKCDRGAPRGERIARDCLAICALAGAPNGKSQRGRGGTRPLRMCLGNSGQKLSLVLNGSRRSSGFPSKGGAGRTPPLGLSWQKCFSVGRLQRKGGKWWEGGRNTLLKCPAGRIGRSSAQA